MRPRAGWRAFSVAGLAVHLLSPSLAAQDRCEVTRCVTVAPGRRYDAGGLHRALFGSRHRDLWSIPVEVVVLDLERFAGGLTPLRRGGGGQTTSLHFRGADGRRYVFRSVDKDATQGLPAEMARTFVAWIAQDQISSLHPYAALVVAPLLEAAGVLHADPQLVVMPDDPRLATFREEFGGLLGLIEERPNEGPDGMPGFAGASRVLGTKDLFEQLSEGPEPWVDARAFLTARLLDVYLGDRDRHADQWRWALVDDSGRQSWRPIPRDRDQAFVGLDGLMVSLARMYQPRLVRFDTDYPGLLGATYAGRGLDRRLLSALEKPVWDSVATALQRRLSNEVIEQAVRRLPPEIYAVGGAWLVAALQARRDRMREMARNFYRLLATDPDVHATDAAEYAEVRAQSDGSVDLRIYASRSASGGTPYFRRTFWPQETNEVRLLMHGGDDRVVVSGAADRRVFVRVIGGGGDDQLIDSSTARGGKPILFYSAHGADHLEAGPRTRVDRRPRPERDLWERFPPPPPPDPTVRQAQNWGGFRVPQFWLSAGSDLGILIGGGVIYYRYGFRHSPYRYRIDARAAYASGATTGRAEFTVTAPTIAGRLGGSLLVRGSGIEIIRFHGFGNGTSGDAPPGVAASAYFEVDQQEVTVEPALALALGSDIRLVGGPFFKLVRTGRNPQTHLAATLPDEIDRTRKHIGAAVTLRADTRDVPGNARRGFLFQLEGTFNAGLFDELADYGSVRGEVATYLSPTRGPATPTLAMRFSAERLWGRFPFYEAVFLGGSQTLRGFDRERFAGDAAVLGNAELRLPVGRHSILIPGRMGLFALADAGRVFFEQDTADEFHTNVGAGLWFSFLRRGNTVSAAAVRSSEGVRMYVRGGFLF